VGWGVHEELGPSGMAVLGSTVAVKEIMSDVTRRGRAEDCGLAVEVAVGVSPAAADLSLPLLTTMVGAGQLLAPAHLQALDGGRPEASGRRAGPAASSHAGICPHPRQINYDREEVTGKHGPKNDITM
jgi:hypothetical protein